MLPYEYFLNLTAPQTYKSRKVPTERELSCEQRALEAVRSPQPTDIFEQAGLSKNTISTAKSSSHAFIKMIFPISLLALSSVVAAATFDWNCENSLGPCNNACFRVNCKGTPLPFNYDSDMSHRGPRRTKSGCNKTPCTNTKYKKYGNSCDEFPFASVKQGGDGATLRCVDGSENSSEGGQLSNFYKNLKNGDSFGITVKNFKGAKYCDNANQCKNDGSEFKLNNKGNFVNAKNRRDENVYYVDEDGKEYGVKTSSDGKDHTVKYSSDGKEHEVKYSDDGKDHEVKYSDDDGKEHEVNYSEDGKDYSLEYREEDGDGKSPFRRFMGGDGVERLWLSHDRNGTLVGQEVWSDEHGTVVITHEVF
ncbi:hypothetical protein MMC07_008820 [Pseudocyphellaria aurata]|nr:hypothetical protein [Pseudocyphellaria aurata]